MKSRTYALTLVLLAVFFSGMSGCESVPQPQTVRQGLAYGYATVTASREQTLELLQKNRITKAEAQMVQRMADAARGALDVADAYEKSGDTTRAQQALTVANESLKQLTVFLNGRKT